MMGGLTFMVKGKMCVGIIKDELMVRIAPEMQDAALEREGCRRMEFTGRPLRGFLLVDETGMGTKRKLEVWVNLALDYNKSAKASKPKPKANAKGKTTVRLKSKTKSKIGPK
jgi:TfoX/Sxy family transcriptional regulator of competence genes